MCEKTREMTKSIPTLISRKNLTEPRPLARAEFYIEGATFGLRALRKQKRLRVHPVKKLKISF